MTVVGLLMKSCQNERCRPSRDSVAEGEASATSTDACTQGFAVALAACLDPVAMGDIDPVDSAAT